MKKNIFKILFFSMLAISCFSCKDDMMYGELVRDNKPAVPVTFPGAITYGFNPYIETSITGGGNISFTLAIPENSGRTIKEISKVGAGATAINAATLNSASYTPTPMQGSGTSATFTTTIAEFNRLRRTATTQVAVGQELAFIFLVTLDDDTQIITTQVRARVVQ